MASTRPVTLLLAVLLGAGCDDPDRGARPVPTTPPAAVTATTSGPPDAGRFLPPLEGYRTDDAGPVGDETAALDDAEVPYAEVRRRLVLDEDGFTRGEVLVVTFRPGAEADRKFLRAWFGTASGPAVEVGAAEMVRISRPHGAADVLVWTGPAFAVVFSRAQEMSDRWLFDLARATVAAAAP